MTTRIVTDNNGRKHITNEPLLHSPQRTWVGLTDEEILNLGAGIVDFKYAAAIEAKLRSKNEH